MAVVYTNNASSRLAVALTTSATSLSVTAGEGAKYPSVSAGSGNWFPLTLIKASGALEILQCTARSGDVFTVVRAQEGTAAQAFSVGDRVELRLTSAALAQFMQGSQFSAFTKTLIDDADAAAWRATLELGTAALKNSADAVTPAYGSLPEAQVAWGGGGGLTLAQLNSLTVNLHHTVGASVLPNASQGVYLPFRHASLNFGGGLALDFDGNVFTRGLLNGVWSGFRAVKMADSMPTVTAGEGLTGGGQLNANRTIDLGTPGTITSSTSNSTSADSHTHALTLTTADITTLNAAAGLGTIGTYALLKNISGSYVAPGSTILGSSLRYSSAANNEGVTPTGTWRAMGQGHNNDSTIYLRIS